MYQNFIKIFNFLAVGIAIFLLLFSVIKFYESPNLLLHPDYFVNYEGGFIRRGFDGQILYNLSNCLNINFITILKFYSTITFCLLILVLIVLKIRKNIPSFILFSMSALLLYLCYLDRGLRKDHILFLLIILQSILFSKENYLKTLGGKLAFILISLFGTLIHEVFFVITIIPCLIGFWIQSKNNYLVFFKKTILLLPSILLFFALITIFVGTKEQTNLIINSYQNINYNLDYLKALFGNTYYFWDQNYNLKNILIFFTVLLLHGLFICTSVYPNLKNNKQKKIFLALLFGQMMVLVFLSLIAIDYGRWVFLCFFTVIVYTYNYFIPEKVENPFYLDFIFHQLKYLPFFLFFLLTMPHSHWNGIDGLLKNNLILQLKNKLYTQ